MGEKHRCHTRMKNLMAWVYNENHHTKKTIISPRLWVKEHRCSETTWFRRKRAISIVRCISRRIILTVFRMCTRVTHKHGRGRRGDTERAAIAYFLPSHPPSPALGISPRTAANVEYTTVAHTDRSVPEDMSEFCCEILNIDVLGS